MGVGLVRSQSFAEMLAFTRMAKDTYLGIDLGFFVDSILVDWLLKNQPQPALKLKV